MKIRLPNLLDVGIGIGVGILAYSLAVCPQVRVHDVVSVGIQERAQVQKFDYDCRGDAHAAAVAHRPVCGTRP